MSLSRQCLKQNENGILYCLSRTLIHFADERQMRLASGESDNRLLFPLFNDGSHFPVTQTLAAVDDRGSFVHTYPVGERSPPVIVTIMLATLLLTTQVTVQIASKVLICQDIQVDHFQSCTCLVFCSQVTCVYDRMSAPSTWAFEKFPSYTSLPLVATFEVALAS
jgi:hypothetical protein